MGVLGRGFDICNSSDGLFWKIKLDPKQIEFKGNAKAFVVDWRSIVGPTPEHGDCFDAVMLEFGDPPVIVIKHPQAGDGDPFEVPLCGDPQTVFLTFRQGLYINRIPILIDTVPRCWTAVDHVLGGWGSDIETAKWIKPIIGIIVVLLCAVGFLYSK